MAYTEEWTEIERVKIKVATGIGEPGQSITVNVCDDSNTDGCYREVYRLPYESGITVGDVSRNRTLDELDHYLMNRGAVKEGPRHTR